MMGFSPAVLASGDRTFLFVYIGRIFVAFESICNAFEKKGVILQRGGPLFKNVV